jgi:hypothetical protein
LLPDVVGVKEQPPAATVPVQVAVASVTVTFPVGVPLPGATGATVKVTAIAWPTTEGSGVWPVIVVAVLARLTVWAAPGDVLVVKFASPAYVAVRFFVPAEVGVSVQVPVATVPLQLAVPSLTLTLPVGVPPAEVTVKLTATPWPTTDGFGVCVVIDVVVPAGLTVTVAVCVIATPLIVADTVFDPAAVELRVPVATPVPSVVAAGCVSVFPVVGAAASATVAPPIGFPFPSRAVTVIVEVPVPTVIGDVAVTVD